MSQIQFVAIKKTQIVSNLCFYEINCILVGYVLHQSFFGGNLQFFSPKRKRFIFVFLNFRLYSPCVKSTQNFPIKHTSSTSATNGIKLARINIIMMMFGISVSSFLIAITANMKNNIVGIIYINNVSILFQSD